MSPFGGPWHDPGRVVTTFYACLASVQSIETLLPQWLVLPKGISAGQNLKSTLIQMEHGRHVTHLVGLNPVASPGDIEVNEVSFTNFFKIYSLTHGIGLAEQ